MRRSIVLVVALVAALLQTLNLLVIAETVDGGSGGSPATLESRTFTDTQSATDTASTMIVTPAGGLFVYVTDHLDQVFDPDLNQTVTVTGHTLKYSVDPNRVTSIVDNGTPRSIASGEAFTLDTTNAFGLTPVFPTLLPQAAAAADIDATHTRVVIPYGLYEGGCTFTNQLGGPECSLPPAPVQQLNGDSDYFDTMVVYAVVMINRSTKTIESVQSRVATGRQGQAPFATNGSQIAYFNPQSGDAGCVFPGGRSGECFNFQAQHGPNIILSLYDVDTTQSVDTTLRSDQAPGQSAPDFNVTVVAGPKMGGDLLAFMSQEAAGTNTMPERTYNDDGDTTDTVIRYVKVSDLMANPAATPTVGPLLRHSNTVGEPLGLIGTDGASIAYALAESEFPVTSMPPNCLDLNGDCDNSDFVLQVMDVATSAITNTRIAIDPSMVTVPLQTGGVVAGGIVAFALPNGDSKQLGFYDIGAATGVLTDVTLAALQASTMNTDPVTDGAVISFVKSAYPFGSSGTSEIHFITLPGSAIPSVNSTPFFVSPSPPNGTVYTVLANSTFTLTAVAQDADQGDTLLLAANAPAAAAVNVTGSNPSTLTLSWTPGPADAGNTTTINITATDNHGAVVTQTYYVIVPSIALPGAGVGPVDASDSITVAATVLPTTDAVPFDASLNGVTSWLFQMYNHAGEPHTTPATFTQPMFTINSALTGVSGTLVPENVTGSIAFPFVEWAPTLPPLSGMRQDFQFTNVSTPFTPGFNSSRTVAPEVISNGGAFQTVTITVTPVDARYTASDLIGTNLTINLSGNYASLTSPTNLDQNETVSAQISPDGNASWSLSNPILNKSYVFTGTQFVPNSFGASIDSKPSASVQMFVAHRTAIVDGPSVSIADPILGGSVVFSVVEPVEWHPRSPDQTFLIQYPNQFIVNTPPPPPNNPPAFISPTPFAPLTVQAGSHLHFEVWAQDPDPGDTVVVTVDTNTLPSGSGSGNNGYANPAYRNFDWTPASGDVGSHNVVFTATDSHGASITIPVTVTVTPPPATLTSISVEPSTVTLSQGQTQVFQARGHYSDGSSQLLPVASSGSGNVNAGPNPPNWSVHFFTGFPAGACSPVPIPGGLNSQGIVDHGGSVQTTWASVINVSGTITPQAVNLNVSCTDPSFGVAPGTVTATWTGTEYDGTFNFAGGQGALAITGWSQQAPMLTPRFGVTAASAGGRAFAIGGTGGSCNTYPAGQCPYAPLSTVEAYDPPTNFWSTVASLNVAREGAGAAAIGTKIYVAGGHAPGGIATDALEVFDTANPAGGWTLLQPSQAMTARADLAVVSDGAYLYALGGDTTSANTGLVNLVERYDPSANTWTALAPMPVSGSGFVAGVINGSLIVAGADGSPRVDVYDIAGGFWHNGTPMPAGRNSAAGGVAHGGLWVVGGTINGQLAFPSWVYYPATNMQPEGWAGIGTIPTRRWQLAGAIVNDVVYAIGGSTDSSFTGDASFTSAGTEALSTPMLGDLSTTQGPSQVVQWQSTNPSAVSINPSGLATAGALGQSTIVASFGNLACNVNDCATVSVNAAHPTASFGVPSTLPEGATLFATGSYSDPSGQSPTARVNYGDGSGDQVLMLNGGSSGSFNLSHTYVDNGVYTVTVYIDDSAAGTGMAQQTVTFTNVAPHVFGPPNSSTQVNSTQTFACISFNDPGINDGPWTLAIDFGDSTGVQTTQLGSQVSCNQGGGNVSHQYAAAGTYTLVATVTDKDGGAGSTSIQVTVSKGTTSVNVNGPNSINAGQSANYSVNVNHGPGSPTGTVTLFDNGVQIGQQPLPAPPANSQVNFQISNLAVGSHPISASYSGDAAFNSSSSPTITTTVNKSQTNTNLNGPGSITYGNNSTFTASVNHGGGPTPTGSITFRDGNTTLSTAPVNASGQASLVNVAFGVGGHTLFADYSGDGVYQASTSPQFTLNVNKANVNVSVNASPSSPTFGQSVTLTANIGFPPNTATPTGTVQFFDNGSNIGAPVGVTANSNATFSTSTLFVGSNTISARYSGDGNFNTRSCLDTGNCTTVTVVDRTAPTLTVAPALVTKKATSASGANVDFSFALHASDDATPNPTVTCTPASGSTFAIGTTPVSCTARDQAGNTSQPASLTVEVDDVPLVTVPANITAEATSSAGAAVSFSVSATDYRGDTLTPQCFIVLSIDPQNGPTLGAAVSSGSTFPIGSTNVGCLATVGPQTNGNIFSITVNDSTGPTLTLPTSPIAAPATSASGAVVTFTATASDLVDGSEAVTCVPASGSTFAIGSTTVNCSATDAHNNTTHGSFTVTVSDTTPPVVTVPADKTAEAASPGGAVVTFTASATDAVDGPTAVSCSPVSGSTFPLGTTTVTCSSTDAHGNTGSNTFKVNVLDTTAPTLTLPASPVTASATSASGAVVTFTATASDIVDGSVAVTCVPASGSTFAIGSTTVNCSATDAHNNTAHGSFTVTVTPSTDTTPPVVRVPANITRKAKAPEGDIVHFNATAHDKVDGVTPVTCTPPSGSLFPIGTTQVTCTSTDAHGNVGTASFTITIVDERPPVVKVPNHVNAEATSAAGAVVTFDATANDAIDGPVPVTCSPSSGSMLAIGSTTVNCSATDAHGNTGTASLTVIVVDTAPPAIVVPADIVAEAGSAVGAVVMFTASATDVVDGTDPVVCLPASGSTFAFGATRVTCTSTDQHGNTSKDSFKVTVRDTTPPVVTVPSTITVPATTKTGADVTFDASAFDNIDGALDVRCRPASGAKFKIGTTTVTCSATDSHGNKGSAAFDVVVTPQ
jgi:hypothetical protein